MPLRIDCYMSMTCGSEDELRDNINRVLEQEGIEAEANFRRITDDEAERLGLKGSPSILINGHDIQPATVTGFS